MDRRYYNLDLVKILTAILIVFHHYQQLSGAVFKGVNFLMELLITVI